MDEVRRSRRGLLVFFGALIPLSAAVDALILLRPFKISRVALILALMWTPALASFIARLATREGFTDLSLSLRGRRVWRALYVGAVFPLVVGAIAYGVAWRFGLAPFEAPDEDPAWMLPLWMVKLTGSPEARFAQSLGLHLTISAVSGCLFAAGEEIGWRGYMVPRMVSGRVRWAIPLSGVVWAAWHYPLAIGKKGDHLLFSMAMFMVLLVPLGGLFARLRLSSGSVWPAIVLHGLWNEVIGFVFGGFTPTETIWVGESGVLVVGVSIALCVPMLRGRWAARRRPGEAPYAWIGFLSVIAAALCG